VAVEGELELEFVEGLFADGDVGVAESDPLLVSVGARAHMFVLGGSLGDGGESPWIFREGDGHGTAEVNVDALDVVEVFGELWVAYFLEEGSAHAPGLCLRQRTSGSAYDGREFGFGGTLDVAGQWS